mgnify:CR=1 FL=1
MPAPDAPLPTLMLDGPLTAAEARDAWHRLLKGLPAKGDVHLDGSGLTAIDGAGLQLLLAVEGAVAGRAGRLRFVGASETLCRALDLVGLDRMLAREVRP